MLSICNITLIYSQLKVIDKLEHSIDTVLATMQSYTLLFMCEIFPQNIGFIESL